MSLISKVSVLVILCIIGMFVTHIFSIAVDPTISSHLAVAQAQNSDVTASQVRVYSSIQNKESVIDGLIIGLSLIAIGIMVANDPSVKESISK